MRLAFLLLLTGCASPLAPLRWDPLPDLLAVDLPAPDDDVAALEAGDLAPWPGVLLTDSDRAALEARSLALDVALDALAAERAGRLQDRAYAAEASALMAAACKRRQRAACAACAALGALGAGATVGGAAGAGCR